MRMHKMIFIRFTWIAVLLFSAVVVNAQDTATPLEFGELVEGEITNEQFEVRYSFAGRSGDIIVIEMRAVDTLGDLDEPAILLLDEKGSIVDDTLDTSSFNRAILVTTLPDTATYTVIASRKGGRSGESVGEYTLEMILPRIIRNGDKVNDSATNDGRTRYYVLMLEEAASLYFEKTSGEMGLDVKVRALGSLTDDFAATGKKLTVATLGQMDANTPYIVTVGRALFDFTFGEASANFVLSTSKLR